MTPEVIRERLSSLRELDFAGAERLAEEMAKDARKPLGSLARMLEWSKYHDRSKVESVLKLLDELSILPWLSACRNLEGTTRTQALSEAYRIYQDLDRRVIEKLRGMLKEQTPIPPAASTGPIEVPVAVTRECDEAYLLLRRLDKPDEADADDRRYRLSFARMTEEERDGRIGHYVQTGGFK